MRKLFYAAAAVAAMIAGSTSASATVLVTSPGTITPPGSASFGSGQITNPDGTPFLFHDQIQFTLGGPNPALADSSLITFLLNGSQNISFACQACSLFLDTVAMSFHQTQFDPQAEAWQLDPVTINPGLHTIFANGVLAGPNGSYAGTVNVQPALPEPATWALMILGFGAVGWQMRRRRPVLAQAA